MWMELLKDIKILFQKARLSLKQNILLKMLVKLFILEIYTTIIGTRFLVHYENMPIQIYWKFYNQKY